jgi:peptidoglycan/LPS O-acetylase OafA/YrhL
MNPKVGPMSFSLYLVGLLVLLCGLVYVAVLLHTPTQWIVAGGIVIAGIGILSAVSHTRAKDKSV